MTADRRASRTARGRLIEARWAEGLSLKAIAAELGWTVGSLGREMDWLRKHGHDLPHRYAMRDGKRAAV